MSYLALSIAVTALVTYALRAVPLLLLRTPFENQWIISFLYYVPWAVLTAMTIPAIFYATSWWVSALAGFITAVALALLKRSLATVALGAAVVVWFVELLM
ncbi:MAG: AzlD domain-containing protein [Actinomycetaceae bacterium]|nr:AzlD domain-containing protein [Actinomycetaceae bacterium]